jgi:two-component system, LytTR family, response regulator
MQTFVAGNLLSLSTSNSYTSGIKSSQEPPVSVMITPAIRTIIADDEHLARKKLRLLLGAEPAVQVVAECQDGQETISAVQAHKPDLLLIDIRMPDLDGFQVLKQIPPEEMPVVVFTTAFDQFAIRAFEAHALDYLLKPFEAERLHHAIERARAELLKFHNRDLTSRILHLLASSAEPKMGSKPVDDRMVIRAGGKVVFLDVKEIDWIEAAANYVKLIVGKDSYLLREGIGSIAERLDPERFVRIHRSAIVNIHKIKELQPCESGEYIAVLKNGKELSCSRGYRTELQRLIGKTL